jgi:hypothetical protein
MVEKKDVNEFIDNTQTRISQVAAAAPISQAATRLTNVVNLTVDIIQEQAEPDAPALWKVIIANAGALGTVIYTGRRLDLILKGAIDQVATANIKYAELGLRLNGRLTALVALDEIYAGTHDVILGALTSRGFLRFEEAVGDYVTQEFKRSQEEQEFYDELTPAQQRQYNRTGRVIGDDTDTITQPSSGLRNNIVAGEFSGMTRAQRIALEPIKDFDTLINTTVADFGRMIFRQGGGRGVNVWRCGAS